MKEQYRGEKPNSEKKTGKPYEHRESKPRFDKREERAPRGEFERREGKPYEHRESKPRFDKRDRYDSFNRYDGFDHREPRGERAEFERRDRDSKPYPPRGERPEFERRDRDSKPYPPRGGFERRDGRFGVDRNHGVNANPDGFKIVTARDAALSALRDVVRNGAYSSQALDRSLNAVELSPEDRRLAASIFFFAVENRLYIEWALSHLMQTKAEPLVEDVMHVAAAQILFMDRIPDHAATDEAVKQVRAFGREGLTGLVNGVLRSLTRARDAGELTLPDRETEPEKYLSVRYSFSEAAAKRLIASYGIDEAEAIASYTPAERAQTVRPNLMKTDIADFERRLDEAGYMWHESAVPGAYRVLAAGDLSATDDYRRGMFAIQGESSQLAALAMEAKPGMQILDACAAPGGKSTQLAGKLQGRGLLVCNEINAKRAKILAGNIERLGIANALVLNEHPKKLEARFEGYFDKILVDAPCSGEGMFRKEEAAVTDWTEDTNAICANRQSEILTSAAKMLRPGGRLVYSTCTFSPVENECVISDFLWRNPDFSVENRPAPDFSPGRPDWVEHPAPGLEHTFRLWPHKLRGEGHYAAVLKKAGDAPAAELLLEPAAKTPAELTQFCRQTGAALPEGKLLLFGQVAYLVPQELPEIKGLRVLRAGLELGQTMKNRFEPAHAWALWLKGLENSVSLAADAPELGQYLSGNVLPSGLRGWTLVRVDGLSLGWAKGDGTQLKNHYPKALRRPV